jgi:hypothetical protein
LSIPRFWAGFYFFHITIILLTFKRKFNIYKEAAKKVTFLMADGGRGKGFAIKKKINGKIQSAYFMTKKKFGGQIKKGIADAEKNWRYLYYYFFYVSR